MITLTEIKRELVEEKEKYFKNYLYWCKKIKEIAKKLLGKDVKVLIFGSVVKGKWGLKEGYENWYKKFIKEDYIER
jgi:hypothetical protein